MDHHREQLLIIRPSEPFLAYEEQFIAKYDLIKAYESPLPIHTFLHKYAQSAKAILCFGQSPVQADLLRHLPSLQIVVTSGTGVDHIDLPACRRRRIAVANTSDIFSQDTADYAVGLLIAVLRKITSADGFVRRSLFEDYPLGSSVRNKRVGIVGLGNIGSKVAKRLEALGCRISYTGRKQKETAPYAFYGSIRELAADSDILVVCCSLTEKTRHAINDDVLGALGKEGILINIGRGPIVDEKALVKRLMRGEIGGAALDVFEDEPRVPPELMKLENVVLSPHRAAFTREAFADAVRIITANLDAFFANNPLISPVP